MELIGWLFWFGLLGAIGAAIGSGKGRVAAGFWLGFFLGPIGWIIIAVGHNFKAEREDAVRREKEERRHQEQLAELRAIRAAPAAPSPAVAPPVEFPPTLDYRYWVRLANRDLGPIDKVDMLMLYSAGKITLETKIARDLGGVRIYRTLGEEVPGLKTNSASA